MIRGHFHEVAPFSICDHRPKKNRYRTTMTAVLFYQLTSSMPAMLLTESFFSEPWSFLSSAVAVLWTIFFFLRGVPCGKNRCGGRKKKKGWETQISQKCFTPLAQFRWVTPLTHVWVHHYHPSLDIILLSPYWHTVDVGVKAIFNTSSIILYFMLFTLNVCASLIHKWLRSL